MDENGTRLQWQLWRLSNGQVAVGRMGVTNGEWVCRWRG